MATDDNVVSDPKDDKAEGKSKAEEKDNLNTETKSKSATDSSSGGQESEKKDSAATEKDNPEMDEKLRLAEEKAAEHWDEVLRARADLENTRKRLDRDVENAHKYAVEKFMQGLLPVIDSLEMGLAAANQKDADINKVKEGTELTLKMFADCVDKFGIQSVDPMGEKFDPEFHQAMSIQETDEQKPDTVIAVMQKGYLLNGRLVRPAMVVVSKAVSESAEKDKNKSASDEKPEKNS